LEVTLTVTVSFGAVTSTVTLKEIEVSLLLHTGGVPTPIVPPVSAIPGGSVPNPVPVI